jgi:putative hydrolase of the HAD superfamily
LSNGNADINRLPISTYFNGQVSAADAGVKKPDAKIFTLGCKALDLEPESVLHVGDHPVEDVVGALDAGLTAVWVNRSAGVWEQQQKPSAEVTSMLGLVELLAR